MLPRRQAPTLMAKVKEAMAGRMVLVLRPLAAEEPGRLMCLLLQLLLLALGKSTALGSWAPESHDSRRWVHKRLYRPRFWL